jgi:hypothetical protein
MAATNYQPKKELMAAVIWKDQLDDQLGQNM